MKRFSLVIAFSAFIAIGFNQCSKKNEVILTRSFYLGVTPWPADFTEAELNTAYNFINNNCDIVSHHFDEGIPYEEAFNNSSWPTALVTELTTRKSKTATGKKVLLSSSALDLTRKSKAPYSKFSETLPASTKNKWEAMPVNNDSVVTAYVHYMLYLATTLQPSYINFGVESNELSWHDADFMLYKDFISKVYQRLKIALPTMPLMVSFMVTEHPASLSLARQLMPFTDYVALSAYPYTHVSSSAAGNTDPALFPADFFTRFISLDVNKPFCFSETGYIAEDLSVPSFSLNKQGTAVWQDNYLALICKLTNERKGKFIIWFCQKDYDAGNNTLRSLGIFQDLFSLWEDTGLTDENNNKRPAYNTWLGWMQRKKSE
jgi:hypothetical protein